MSGHSRLTSQQVLASVTAGRVGPPPQWGDASPRFSVSCFFWRNAELLYSAADLNQLKSAAE